ncbi:MAG: hypothetical protein ABI114_15260 [Rhodanobacter sp.]
MVSGLEDSIDIVGEPFAARRSAALRRCVTADKDGRLRSRPGWLRGVECFGER